ncbi:RNA polymerase sigma factor [Natranaerofaba carboxydovora]|uniref:RNA polymerase sigma factor n=1 Tax=Natranaerofaba carboxydovora TaxID=2742683 RepID=UPI001F12F56F|nr:sigma-70 family RNA polymerase sigma factor [Natranaerofaba carboxydovora]
MIKKPDEELYDFDEIYENYNLKIYNFLYYKVQNHEEAQELTQDTFRKAWTKIKNLELTEEQIQSYLYTTAKNTLYDTWRKRRIKTVSIDNVKDSASEMLLPEDQAIEKEEMETLRSAMDKLPPDQKKVLELRVMEGLSSKVVALKMLKTPGAVRNLQYRGIKNLRDILKGMEAFENDF